jgi:ABC-type transporter Mla subunit MlaD
VLLLAATALLAVGPKERHALGVVALVGAAAVTAGGLWLARRPGSRAPFRAAIVVAAVDVALLLAGGSSLA